MSPRAIASLSISFGLVAIRVKLYSATEPGSGVSFKLMGRGGSLLRQQYVTANPPPSDLSEESYRNAEPSEPTGQSKTVVVSKPRVGDLPVVSDSGRGNSWPPSAETDVPPRLPIYTSSSPTAVRRSEMVKGFEFERGKFVLFTPDELSALAGGARQTIDIVAFIPE
jgi:hypothetical protein